MTQTTKDVRVAVLGALKACGWTKSRNAAALSGDDAIVTLDVQASQWSDAMYINVGVWLRALETTAPMKQSYGHLRFRIEKLVEGFPAPIESAATVNVAELLVAVTGAEPALRRLARLDELRARAALGRLDDGLIMLQARSMLVDG